MKRTALILALILAGACGDVEAADIDVDLGNLVVPDAAVESVVEWLASEVLYATTYTTETRTDPDTGEIVTIRTRVQTVVAETPLQKIRRIAGAGAKSTVVSKFQAWHQAKQAVIAQAAQDAAMAALPSPIATTTVAATTTTTTTAQ